MASIADIYDQFRSRLSKQKFGPGQSVIWSTINDPKLAAEKAADWLNQSYASAGAYDPYSEEVPERSIESAIGLAGLMQTGAMPFAPKSSGGTLGTLIGERGIKNMGAGETLEKAKEMLANKANPKDVWKETLVMQHPTTDAFLMKIPSNKATFTGETQKQNYENYINEKINSLLEYEKQYPQDAGSIGLELFRNKRKLEDLKEGYLGGTLDRFLNFPELYKAYPRAELMDVSIEPNLDSAGAYRGYSTGSPEIAMRSDIASRENSEFSPERVLSHELGHFVAHEEGLPMGGSPETAAKHLYAQEQEFENKYKPTIQQYKSLTNMIGDVFSAQYLNKLRSIAESEGNIAPRRINNLSDFYRHSDEIRSQLGPMPKKAGPERNGWIKQAAGILYEKAYEAKLPKYGESLIERLSTPSRSEEHTSELQSH